MATNANAKAPAPPASTMLDTTSFTAVVIVKAGDHNGLTYRRGQRLHVNAATLDALKAGGLIDGTSG